MSENIIVPNSFQTPNIYIDRAQADLTPSEFSVLMFAVRHILGWRDRVHERRAHISLNMFMNGFRIKRRDGSETVFGGVGLSKTTVIKALDTLCLVELLICTDKDNAKGACYELNDEPDWALLRTIGDNRRASNKDRTNHLRTPVILDENDGCFDDGNGVVYTVDQSSGYTSGGLASRPAGGLANRPNQTHSKHIIKESVNVPFTHTPETEKTDDSTDIHQSTDDAQSVKPKKARKATEKKPRERDAIFDAVQLHVFGIGLDKPVNGGHVAAIATWLKGSANGKIAKSIGVLETPATPEQIEAFAAFYHNNKDARGNAKPLTPPQGVDNFPLKWLAYLSFIEQSGQTNGNTVQSDYEDAQARLQRAKAAELEEARRKAQGLKA